MQQSAEAGGRPASCVTDSLASVRPVAVTVSKSFVLDDDPVGLCGLTYDISDRRESRPGSAAGQGVRPTVGSLVRGEDFPFRCRTLLRLAECVDIHLES